MTTREVAVAGDESAGTRKSTGPVSRKRKVGGVRKTRAVEQRAAKPVRAKEEEPWVNPTSLKAPPARPGMVQRWIRVGSRGQFDATNFARKTREGWKPRKADTVPENFPVPKLEHGRFDGCIGVEGMVLMEMPKERDKARNEFFRKRGEAVTQAIENDLENANRGLAPGIGPIRRNQQSIPVRERQVAVAEDEGGSEE